MDALRLGATLRAARVRRGLRQVDLARLAHVSDATVSRIERGHLAAVTFGTVEAVAHALEIRLDHRAWSRAGDLDRLVNARHGLLVEDLVATLVRQGWTPRPELSFNERGERGFVDILAVHPGRSALLVIEVKTELVDVGELLGTLDRKRRLAPLLAQQLGWRVSGVPAVAVVLGASRTNRRRLAEHAASLRAVLPEDGRRLRAYLRDPARPVAALAFWPCRHGGTLRPGWSAIRRVRRRA